MKQNKLQDVTRCYKMLEYVLSILIYKHITYIIYLCWLMVWNMDFIFPYIGNFIIPIDELIFFRGVGCPHQPDRSSWSPGEKDSSEWTDALGRVFLAVFVAEWGDRTQDRTTPGDLVSRMR